MAGRFPVYMLDDLDNGALGKIGAPVRNTSEAKEARLKVSIHEAREAV